MIDGGYITRIERLLTVYCFVRFLSLDQHSIKAEYLLDIIKQCQESKVPESPANLRRIKICIYIDALINFLKGVRNTRQNMNMTNFSDIAERVETDIRKNFRQPDTLKMYVEQIARMTNR